MNTWKGHLLWAAFPVAALLVTFGLMATVNWGYESKLFDRPELLALALGMAFLGSFLLLLIRLLWLKSQTTWFLLPLTLVTIFLVFPGLFIVILGPAAITMSEQVNSEAK